MVFSTPEFLFLFLPITLAIVFLLPGIKAKNTALLLISLLFYSWGEPDLVFMMIIMIVINYFFGRKIGSSTKQHKKRNHLIAGIIINLLALVYFKYSNFIVDNINVLLELSNIPTITINKIRLPIGISFYTFQSLSYLIDVYRKETEPQKNPINLGLYIALFPQLIAGPIVRYHDIAQQIKKRELSFELFYSGTKKFIAGLGKKILIANIAGFYADKIFEFAPEELSPSILALGAILYSFQIYFDFSGYSDMAIGLGRMFGFKLLENFNFPYISTSIKEFWRRWHISLSNWFRDYLYIPLGGNRTSKLRVYINLSIVFFITGLWHGASWNFIIWGLWHGLFLIIERLGFSKILDKIPKVFRHVYMLTIVVIGWILFKVESIDHFLCYMKTMLSFNHTATYNLSDFVNKEIITVTILGIIFSTPLLKARLLIEKFTALETATYLLILLLSILSLSTSTYNPFIYFQF